MAQEPLLNQTEAQMAWDDLRTSPAFPAIVGGLAGALGGAALMLIFNRLSQPKKNLPAAYDADGNPMNVVYLPAPEQFRVLGFTLGDLMSLATVGFTLFRQIKDMTQSNGLAPEGTALPDGTTLPPSPAEMPGKSHKK
jgi:hypothetical protein